MSRPPKALVFDLDGTLLDSMPLVLRAYHHALAPYAAPMTDAELMARLGGPPERIFEQLLSDSTHVTGALERLARYSGEAWQLIEPFPGMIDALDAYRRAGCALGVWTGRERASTEWLLQRHGLAGRIQQVVCGDDLGTHKPDPAGLAEILRRLGAPTDDAVFVGDADVDVAAGARLGVRTLHIAHGVPPSATVRAEAWRSVDTPSAAYEMLRTLFPPDTTPARTSVP
jgi:HAD superfamily hydrolase (TIGR01509 family)